MSALGGRATVLTPLMAFTLSTICWSLWVRRYTWRRSGEVCLTLNLAMQGGAVALMSPISSATIGHWLHRATGHHNLEDYIGLDLYVLAATAVVMDALHHLDIDRGDRFRRFVEVPATLTIPTLLPLFALGGGVRVYHPDIFRVPVTDGWFLAFWLVLCSSLIYFLIYAMRSLVPLWKHRPSRRIAGIYMTATASGILACLARITTAFMPSEVQDTMTASLAVWVPALGCGAIFALAAGWVWVSRTRLVPL